MPRLILTFELSFDPSNTRRPHAQFTHTMTEPHHALTVDGEGEDSGGNEVHEIYVRLEAGAREQPPSPVRNKDRDVEAWKDGEGVTLAAQ